MNKIIFLAPKEIVIMKKKHYFHIIQNQLKNIKIKIHYNILIIIKKIGKSSIILYKYRENYEWWININSSFFSF
jgi:hypothetical protein